jgi:hypothetical protein
VQTAANTSDADLLDSEKGDPFASKDAPKKGSDDPLQLDDVKNTDQTKEPPSLSLDSNPKPAEAPSSVEAPNLADAPKKIEEPTDPKKDDAPPKLEPQQDPLPAGDATKPPKKSPEPSDGLFSDDIIKKPAKAHEGAEPALPHPSSADPFGADSKQPDTADKKQPEEPDPSPAPRELTPEVPEKSPNTAEPGRLGDRIDQSAPAPVDAPKAAPSEPPALKTQPSDAATKTKQPAKLKSQPKNLPLIRPRNFKRGSTSAPDANVPGAADETKSGET